MGDCSVDGKDQAMSDFKFNCPGCGQHLAASEISVGQQIQCPTCLKTLVIPSPAAGVAGSEAQAAPPPGLRLSGGGANKSHSTEEPQSAPHGYCPKCGKPLAAGASFCSACGDATGARKPGAAPGASRSGSDLSGLPEHIASGLCYVLIPILGIVFLIVDRRPLVRFHALQSIFAVMVFFALRMVWGLGVGLIMSLFISHAVAPHFPGTPGNIVMSQPFEVNLGMIRTMAILSKLVYLVIAYFWIVCLIHAFRGEKYYLPIAGDIADSIANKK
jgi:uncharacterized membrane protein